MPRRALIGAALGVLGLAVLAFAWRHELGLTRDAEIDWLEQIPVLEHDPH